MSCTQNTELPIWPSILLSHVWYRIVLNTGLLSSFNNKLHDRLHLKEFIRMHLDSIPPRWDKFSVASYPFVPRHSRFPDPGSVLKDYWSIVPKCLLGDSYWCPQIATRTEAISTGRDGRGRDGNRHFLISRSPFDVASRCGRGHFGWAGGLCWWCHR